MSDPIDVERTSNIYGLSDLEAQVFGGLLKNHSYAEIATELNVVSGTVSVAASRLYRKVGVQGKKELLRKIHNEHDQTERLIAAIHRLADILEAGYVKHTEVQP